MTNEDKDTFIRITNRDIYNKIENLESLNLKRHNEIINKQSITNGKVKLNRWIASTALTLIILIVGYIFKT